MSADKFTEALFLAVNDFFSRAKEEVHQLGDVPGKLSQSIDEYWTMCVAVPFSPTSAMHSTHYACLMAASGTR